MSFLSSKILNFTGSRINAFLVLILCASQASAAEPPPEILAVLDRYMNAVNRIDIDGIVDTYHFPHFRLARGEFEVWSTPIEAMPMLKLPREEQLQAMRTGLGPDWHSTEWLYRRMISYSDSKAHVDTEFVRLNSAGGELGRFNSLYILTKQQGVWRIKGRSSFAPR
jgi:hypothetical protein